MKNDAHALQQIINAVPRKVAPENRDVGACDVFGAARGAVVNHNDFVAILGEPAREMQGNQASQRQGEGSEG